MQCPWNVKSVLTLPTSLHNCEKPQAVLLQEPQRWPAAGFHAMRLRPGIRQYRKIISLLKARENTGWWEEECSCRKPREGTPWALQTGLEMGIPQRSSNQGPSITGLAGNAWGVGGWCCSEPLKPIGALRVLATYPLCFDLYWGVFGETGSSPRMTAPAKIRFMHAVWSTGLLRPKSFKIEQISIQNCFGGISTNPSYCKINHRTIKQRLKRQRVQCTDLLIITRKARYVTTLFLPHHYVGDC